MADLSKLLNELSSLTVVEAAELAKLLEDQWQPSKANDPLSRITRLYHFTDRQNLPLIQKLGGLYPPSQLEARGIQIPAPGGNQWSRDADKMSGMDRYVHLCFRPNHPMEYL